MRKYLLELIAVIINTGLFYILPLFAGPTDAMGMVVLMILYTMLLSFILGCASGNWIRFLYPLVIAIVFIPSVYIYYSGGALIHSVWYLVVSYISMLEGFGIRMLVILLKKAF